MTLKLNLCWIIQNVISVYLDRKVRDRKLGRSILSGNLFKRTNINKMSNPENEKCLSSSAESDMYDVLKRGSSTLCEEHLPKCSSDWTCHLVNKLCVRYKLEDIIRIIWSEWRLFHLDDDDRLEVERCVNACDLKLNYESLQDIAPNTTTPIEEFAKTLGPTQRQLRLIQAEPLLDKYVF